jgi:flagellar FliL protein
MADNKKAKKDDKLKDAKEGKEAEEKKADAEGAAEEGAEGEVQPAFTPRKIILFIVLPLFLIVAGGSTAYFMGWFSSLAPHEKLDCEGVGEGDSTFAACADLKAAETALVPGAFIEIPDMIVNLSSPGKQTRFLKISLKIETENIEEQRRLEPILPRVIDQFQMYLRELRIEDLRGTSGVYRMKIELLNRVRAAAPSVKVRDVLFQEILVQ